MAFADNKPLLHYDAQGSQYFGGDYRYFNNSDLTTSVAPANFTIPDKRNVLSFNGTSSIVTVPNYSAINPTNAITLEAYFYSTSSSLSSKEIISKTSYNQYRLTNAGNSVLASFRTTNASPYVDVTATITPNTWNHVVATYDGTDAKIYLNGILIQTVNRPGNLVTTTGNLILGKDQQDSNAYFSGNISSVRIYNRALSATEVSNNFAGNVTRTGLVGEWLLNEGSGTKAIDTSDIVNQSDFDLAGIIVKDAGGNVISSTNVSDYKLGGINTSTGNQTPSVQYFINKNGIVVNSNSKYTISIKPGYYFEIYQYDANSNYIYVTGMVGKTSSFTFTTQSNTRYIYFDVRRTASLSSYTTLYLSSYSNNGDIANGTWIIEKDLRGLSFNGSNQYSFINPIRTSNYFTTEFWFKDISGVGNETLFSRLNNTSPYDGWLIGIDLTTRKVGVYNQRYTTLLTQSTTAVTKNVWYHCVITFDNLKTSIYLNAVKEGTTATVDAINNDGLGLYIATYAGGGDWFGGQMSNLRIYNRVLTAKEIFNLYNGATIRFGLLGQWLLNEGQGTTAVDTGGAGRVNSAQPLMMQPEGGNLCSDLLTTSNWVNLFPSQITISNNSCIIKGISGTYYYITGNKISVIPNQILYFYTNIQKNDLTTSEAYSVVAFYDSFNNLISYSSAIYSITTGKSLYIKVPSNAYTARVIFTSGAYEGSWTFTNPIVKVADNNMLAGDYTGWERGTFSLGAAGDPVSGTPIDSTTRIRTKTFTAVQPSTMYYVSALATTGTVPITDVDYQIRIWEYDQNQNYISNTGFVSGSAGPTTIITGANTAYVRATIRRTNDATINNTPTFTNSTLSGATWISNVGHIPDTKYDVSPCYLHRIDITTVGSAGESLTIYDGTGTIVAVIDLTKLSSYEFGAHLPNGLWYKTSATLTAQFTLTYSSLVTGG